MRLHHRGKYPENWPDIALRVKDEAGWRCARCRHPFVTPERERIEAERCGGRRPIRAGQAELCDSRCDPDRCAQYRKGKSLNYGVHHLDGDKSNCRWWNLIPTCNACHLSIQSRVNPEVPFLWDHSMWFLPYVCGFYAHYYGKLEITRAEAEDIPSRWLLLGQPWRPSGPTHVGEIVPTVMAAIEAKREGAA